MKYAKISAILLFLLFAAAIPAIAMADAIGSITAIQGNVDVLAPGMERAAPAVLQQPLSEGDIIRTKSNGKAEITFVDDSVVRLAPNSRLQITEYLVEGKKRRSGALNLLRGKIRAIVSKSKSVIGVAFTESEKFEVRTPTAVAGVRGTDFIMFYQLGITGVIVLDGILDVFNPALPGQVVRVKKGMATFITGKNPPSGGRPSFDVELIRHIRDTDIDREISDEEEGMLITTATVERSVFGYEAPEGPAFPVTIASADAPILPVTETYTGTLDGGTTADVTPPTVLMASKSAFPSSSSGDTTDINITFSSNEPATYSYRLDGGAWTTTGSSLTLAQLAEGSHTIDYTATDTAGNTSAVNTLSFDLSRYSLSGNFWGCIAGVTGTATGEVAGVSSQNWGGWNTSMTGTGQFIPNPTWTLYAGGQSTDTITANTNGYWLIVAPGTSDYTNQTLSGTSTFEYLSYDRLGTGTGTVAGTYDGSGNYSLTDTGTGTYTETPLAWSGEIDYDNNVFGLYDNGDGIMGVGDTYGGLVGGIQSPWSGTTSLTLMGPYGGPLSTDIGPFMWNAPIYSWNVNTSQYLTYDEGAFWGLNGGIWRDADNNVSTADDRSINAVVYSLYIDPSGNAGILKGNLDGAYYPELLMFSADGTWTPTILATGLDPTTLGSLTYSADIYFSGLSSTAGTFTAGGSINANDAIGLKYSMPGEGWGIWQNLVEGSYSETSSDTWNLSLEHVDFSNNFIVGTQTDGTQWSNNQLAGTTYGYGADITATPMTWISIGETIGTFDPNTTTWMAVQTGAWLDTAKFLSMACPGGVCNPSSSDAATLTALNIPFVEVGRTNLTGTNTDWTINMNDVTFFAYQTGAAPKIWATGDVNGSYSCSACGVTPQLTGNNLTANFNIQTWDTANNKWTATVDGSGTYSGTGTMNGSAVQFNGAAAGANTGVGPGTFSGTAAGTAQ